MPSVDGTNLPTKICYAYSKNDGNLASLKFGGGTIPAGSNL